MHLDADTVERNRLDPDSSHLLALQFLEYLVQDASLGPTTHACLDRVPVAEPFGNFAPLAAVFGPVQQGIDYMQIGHTAVVSLFG